MTVVVILSPCHNPQFPDLQAALETLRGMSPSAVRQVAPILEQLAPMYLELAQGRMEFSPTPEEARHLMQTYYSKSGTQISSDVLLQLSGLLVNALNNDYVMRSVSP